MDVLQGVLAGKIPGWREADECEDGDSDEFTKSGRFPITFQGCPISHTNCPLFVFRCPVEGKIFVDLRVSRVADFSLVKRSIENK
jgi:hypothetical protein